MKTNAEILSDLLCLYKRAWLFFAILAVALVCLRMTGAIGWGWQWALAPLWLPLVIFSGLYAVRYIFGAAVGDLVEDDDDYDF